MDPKKIPNVFLCFTPFYYSSIQVNEYWQNFRNFKVFRPTYAQRALQALSSVQRNEFGSKPLCFFEVLAFISATNLLGTDKIL